MAEIRKPIENKIVAKLGKKFMDFEGGVELRQAHVTFWPAYEKRGRKSGNLG